MSEKQRQRAELMQDAAFSISCTQSCLENARSFIVKDDPCMVRLNILDAMKNLAKTEKRLLSIYYRRKKA